MIDLERQHAMADEGLCRLMGDDYYRRPESVRTASGRRIIDDIADARAFFGWKGSVDELLARRQAIFDQACRGGPLELMPGVEMAVRTLYARGIPLAVTSSAVLESIDLILLRLGLRELFAALVGGGDVTRAKPDPEAYLLTAVRLGVSPAGCVVFEDSTIGVEAAIRAGMFCIAVRNPRAHQRQDLSPADVAIDSFEELDLALFISPSARSAPRRA
jgi:HAD superfamily hydrolase (TIGR01509 family)